MGIHWKTLTCQQQRILINLIIHLCPMPGSVSARLSKFSSFDSREMNFSTLTLRFSEQLLLWVNLSNRFHCDHVFITRTKRAQWDELRQNEFFALRVLRGMNKYTLMCGRGEFRLSCKLSEPIVTKRSNEQACIEKIHWIIKIRRSENEKKFLFALFKFLMWSSPTCEYVEAARMTNSVAQYCNRERAICFRFCAVSWSATSQSTQLLAH